MAEACEGTVTELQNAAAIPHQEVKTDINAINLGTTLNIDPSALSTFVTSSNLMPGIINTNTISGIQTADNFRMQTLFAVPAPQFITAPQQLTNDAFQNVQIITLGNQADFTNIVNAAAPVPAANPQQTKGWQFQLVQNPTNPEILTAVAVQPQNHAPAGPALSPVVQLAPPKPINAINAMNVPLQLQQNNPQLDDSQNSIVNDIIARDTAAVNALLLKQTQLVHPKINIIPAGCPDWAKKLKECEFIGDSYRGYVDTEVELDLLLTYHKQQTHSFWGTRQSPSPAKSSTRLMWKSQYVPFDGTPFINAGSRAIVMECQYGPRRKGAAPRQSHEPLVNAEFRQTCPARIYVKKIKKFPNFAVDVMADKRTIKLEMDKAFQELKLIGVHNATCTERFYVQLPTEKAHEFHADSTTIPETTQELVLQEVEPENPNFPNRLHPRVAMKIRDLVAAGETRVYCIRKQLRRFVEKQLFDASDQIPEKHNLTFFPTVNDLQNHVHQALKDIETGVLPMTTPPVTSEPNLEGDHLTNEMSMWQHSATDNPQPETVTVTLTQNPAQDGQHVISRVETQLSDGTTQITTQITPETVQLLSRLHPGVFPPNVLNVSQMQNLPLNEVTDSLGISIKDELGDVLPVPSTTDPNQISVDVGSNVIMQPMPETAQLSEDVPKVEGTDDI